MAKEEDVEWLEEFSEKYEPFSKYDFGASNPFDNLMDPLAEGKKSLQAGDLPTAVLLFEAAVKQHPDMPQAWQYLGIMISCYTDIFMKYYVFLSGSNLTIYYSGTSQAENEQDAQAIAALKKYDYIRWDDFKYVCLGASHLKQEISQH